MPPGGVVDADLRLTGVICAAERTASAQVGAVPHSQRPGSDPDLMPDQPVMKALALGPRPFLRLRPHGAVWAAALWPARCADRQRHEAEAADFAARALARSGAAAAGVMVLGPAPAPLAVRGRHRPLSRDGGRGSICRRCCAAGCRASGQGSTRVQVDIDPYSF
jgi:primosomal protein N' (replication factor Y)